MADPKTTPTNIQAPHGGDTMHIAWSDGHRGRYPNETLRGYCPCAHCQGHGGKLEFVPGGNAVLRDISTVGNYALKLAWGDGHDTGIYSFRYLRDLCQCDECAPMNDREQ